MNNLWKAVAGVGSVIGGVAAALAVANRVQEPVVTVVIEQPKVVSEESNLLPARPRLRRALIVLAFLASCWILVGPALLASDAYELLAATFHWPVLLFATLFFTSPLGAFLVSVLPDRMAAPAIALLLAVGVSFATWFGFDSMGAGAALIYVAVSAVAVGLILWLARAVYWFWTGK